MAPRGGAARSSAAGAVGRPAASSSSAIRLAWSVVTTVRRCWRDLGREPAAQVLGTPGQDRGRLGSRRPRLLLVELLRRTSTQGLQGGRRLIRHRPVERQLTCCRQPVAPFDGLRVQIARQRDELVRIGQHDVRAGGQVVRGGSCGEEMRPGLGRLGDVALLQATPDRRRGARSPREGPPCAPSRRAG